MRIGFDASVLARSTRYTGTGQYAEKLLEELPIAAPDIEFIVYGEPPSMGMDRPANVCWKSVEWLPAGKLSALATYFLSFPQQLRRDGIDLLHVPTVHVRPSLPPVPRRVTCPMVVTLHDVIPLTFYNRHGNTMPRRLRWFYRWNLGAVRKARQIITVSESSRREIVKTLRIQSERIVSIHNGIDERWSDATSIGVANPHAGERPYLLFGGSYEPRKNLPRLLEAFELAVESGIPHDLVMIVEANSGHAASVRRRAEHLRSVRRLYFLSDLDEAALMAVYRGADLFVFPSLSEGFGLPPLQAMACGVPVIASDLPVMREVLGDAALFVDPYSPEAIAQAISCLALDRENAVRLGEAGRKQAAQFSWRETARRTVDVYREALGAGG